ncbi:poly [ADP-ribose] polymerase 15 isoform X1, partial [Paramuricea clavata]
MLKKGDITIGEGDAIINVLPDSLKLVDGGGVCKSILKCGGNVVQQEIDLRRREAARFIPGAIFHTSAGSIKNVKNIIHFVPSEFDVSALQGDIENCLRLAQKCSFRCILIPAIGTANFGFSPEDSANTILNAATNYSITSNHRLTLIIVVYQEEMLPNFKMVLEDKMKYALVDIPSNWAEQPNGKVVHLVNLPQSSDEYRENLKLFNNGNSVYEVTKIERIQNPGLYRAYIVKRQSMAGKVNERRLFHGTNATNIDKINTNNFSRSFAGEN